MRITVDLPDVTPADMKLMMDYWGMNQTEVIRAAIGSYLDVVREDAISDSNGIYLDSRSDIEDALGIKYRGVSLNHSGSE